MTVGARQRFLFLSLSSYLRIQVCAEQQKEFVHEPVTFSFSLNGHYSDPHFFFSNYSKEEYYYNIIFTCCVFNRWEYPCILFNICQIGWVSLLMRSSSYYSDPIRKKKKKTEYLFTHKTCIHMSRLLSFDDRSGTNNNN